MADKIVLADTSILIDLADLFIAATALTSNLPFSTLNKKHFERIEGLVIVE